MYFMNRAILKIELAIQSLMSKQIDENIMTRTLENIRVILFSRLKQNSFA